VQNAVMLGLNNAMAPVAKSLADIRKAENEVKEFQR